MNEPEKPDLTIGQRVRMRRDPSFAGPWPAEPLGTIVPWPTKDSELFVLVDHAWGQQRAYFVLFDEPQLDADGDGPYYKAEVWERYIEAIVAVHAGWTEHNVLIVIKFQRPRAAAPASVPTR